MRDFRDAKAMAQTLRGSLSVKGVLISHSEGLELVSKMLGVADWNTLSALLPAKPAKQEETGAPIEPYSCYPALPLKDFVPFPTTQFPLLIGREKTKLALHEAFTRQREVVLAVQKDQNVEEPRSRDIHDIGVLAQLLELEHLPEGSAGWWGWSVPNGTMKVILQAHRRVRICRFTSQGPALQAKIEDIPEAPVPDASQLIQNAIKHFERYTAARSISPLLWPPNLYQIRDPGHLADVISSRLNYLSMQDRQALLATIDAVQRLERVVAFMEQRLSSIKQWKDPFRRRTRPDED